MRYCGAYDRVVKALDPRSRDLGFDSRRHRHRHLCKLLIHTASGHLAVMGTWWNAKSKLCEWLQLTALIVALTFPGRRDRESVSSDITALFL
jgi:hypothetical protein